MAFKPLKNALLTQQNIFFLKSINKMIKFGWRVSKNQLMRMRTLVANVIEIQPLNMRHGNSHDRILHDLIKIQQHYKGR